MTRICFVQPVQSPYVTKRMEALAAESGMQVVLLLECAELAHRPGWRPEPICGVVSEVLASAVLKTRQAHADLPYETRSTRTLPWRLPAALRRHRPDIVMVCNATQLLFALPLRAVLGYRIGINVEDTPHTARSLSRLARAAKAWAYRQADFCLSFSRMADEYLRSIAVTRPVHRTSWSMDLGWLAADRQVRDQLRAAQGASNKVVFLFTGALIARKGVLPLLRSWAALSRTSRGIAQLWIAGAGPQENDARDLARAHALDEVRFLGQLSYAAMRDAMAAADIVVLPTFEDRFSLVVPEAMACGRPVITTPYNGAGELIEQGATGWLADVAQEASLTRALARALGRRRDLRRMGELARRKVASMENRDVMAQLATVLKAHSRVRTA